MLECTRKSLKPNAPVHFCVRAVSALMLMSVVWIILITLVREGQNPDEEKIPILIFLFLIALTVLHFPKAAAAKALDWVKNHWRFLMYAEVALFALGLGARFGFLVFGYAPQSDPLVFFNNASAIAQTGAISAPAYISMFPFYHAYIVLLSAVFRVTGSGLFGIVILNTAFDALAAYLVGHLVFLLTKSRKWQLTASAVWWISPFNIVFCAISLPVIVVNALILSVLVSLRYLFLSMNSLKRTLLYSAVAAVALAAEDAFRPISIISVIAIVVYYVVRLMKNRDRVFIRNCALSIAIIVVLSGILGHGWQQAVNAATGLPANTHKQGWSIFVGSNYVSSGEWNKEDRDYMISALEKYAGDASKASAEIQEKGIQRWMALGPLKATGLVVKKSIRLSGNTQNMIYNMAGSYPYWKKHVSLVQAMHVLCAIYWFLMLVFAFYFFFRRRQMKRLDFIGFLSILTIGLLLAFMAVEVANRYFTVFFPMFTVFAVLGSKCLLEALRS